MKKITFLLLLTAFIVAASAKEEKCNLPIARGICLAYMPRFGYNQEKGACERFIYGGCQGNDNMFVSLEACQEACER